MTTLDQSIDAIARTPVLLVACDYDGTLAPIVSDPSDAHPDREAVVAIRSLAQTPSTHVAVVSGRSLHDLAQLGGFGDNVHLVGSHGSEFDAGFSKTLTLAQETLRKEIGDALDAIAAAPGLLSEHKPASVALHFRNAPADVAERALEQVMQGPAQQSGVFVKHGKMVVELCVVSTNKGMALERLRQRFGATAAIFLGDDITDEDAFATLTGPDIGIKVGPGTTHALFRVRDTTEVARTLARLCEQRAGWIAGAAAPAIETLSMLSDQRTCAMIDPDGRLVWFCAPRIDSPALFAELLGSGAGHFNITPMESGAAAVQQYVDQTLVLETRWPTFTVTDFLDCSAGRPTQRPGRTDLIRRISGHGRVRIEFAPRLNFGRTTTTMTVLADALQIEDSLDPIVLHAPGVAWCIHTEGPHHTAVAEVELGAEPLDLTLRYGTASINPSRTPVAARLDRTADYWRKWAEQLTLPELERELVMRSALTIAGLVFTPNGGIAAAATTSLPEHIGGVRNWDYRFCWIRDGAMSARSLVRLGSQREAMHLLDWILAVVDGCQSPDRLRPVYTVAGQDLDYEAEIAELSGYMGSRPVRIGNLAAQQVQLDVFGPVVDLVYELAKADAPLSSDHWRLVERMVEAVRARWHEPDHGIWEVRGPRRHHVHSKAMCWMTIDRAVRLNEVFFSREAPELVALRDAIRRDIEEKGFNATVGGYTMHYGAADADAAVLMLGQIGFCAPDDPKWISTVEFIERELRDGPTVFRYRFDDSLPGIEGGFNICTSWLVGALAHIGRQDDARALFAQLVKLAGPTGLMAEEFDPVEGRALGNHPQAYSHLGVIENALALSES